MDLANPARHRPTLTVLAFATLLAEVAILIQRQSSRGQLKTNPVLVMLGVYMKGKANTVGFAGQVW